MSLGDKVLLKELTQNPRTTTKKKNQKKNKKQKTKLTQLGAHYFCPLSFLLFSWHVDMKWFCSKVQCYIGTQEEAEMNKPYTFSSRG
jgi:hypothetical protein